MFQSFQAAKLRQPVLVPRRSDRKVTFSRNSTRVTFHCTKMVQDDMQRRGVLGDSTISRDDFIAETGMAPSTVVYAMGSRQCSLAHQFKTTFLTKFET